jgi:uncharacterized repeat protein (TIGR01451 family)
MGASPADLEISKTWVDDGGEVNPGDTVTGTLTVTNTGNGPATGVEVRDDPDLDNLENFVINDNGDWEDADTILWQVGDIGAGQSASVSFEATVRCWVPDPAGGADMPIPDLTQICNDDFNVESDQSGTVTGPAPACLEVNRPVLTIAKAMVTTPPITAGDTVDYEITVCNEGSGTADTVVVYDMIDQTWLIVPPAAIGQGGTWNGAAGRIEWTVATLAPGAPTSPVCEILTYSIETDSSTPDQTQICNDASITEETTYLFCQWPFPAAAQDCFDVGGGGANELHKNCCTDAEDPCDRGSKFPLPWLKDIAAPPGQTDDTGLTDTTNPLCFYQVLQPTPGNTVRITKSTTVADTIDIFY